MPVITSAALYTSPDDDIKSVLDGLPATATISIHAEIYGFTDEVLVQAIIDAAKRGVRVSVMNDRSQSAGPKDHAALQRLVDASLPNLTVKVVESEKGAIDHLKVLIIDGDDGALAPNSAVFWGSYNFSDGAEAQDNSAEVTHDPGRVDHFFQKFQHDWTANKQLPAWQIQPSGAAPLAA